MKNIIILALTFLFSSFGHAEANLGETAPGFSVKNQTGKEFKIDSRKGHWTVLYFYPKSETPGCTKQACTFSDSIKKIRALGADVYGISVNTVADQNKFSNKYGLKFDLLADEDGKVTELYGAKMKDRKMSNRWTYLIDPDMKIRSIDKEVDPVKDADRVAEKLKELQAKKK
jgi:thioredoxin-dependent peroxiredoxin